MFGYNFIIPVSTIDEVIFFSNIDLQKSWQIFAVGDYAWSLQTYLILKEHGLPVYLNKRFNRGCINIAFGRTLQRLWKQPDVFVVDVKADIPYDYWGRNLQVVQNKTAEDPKKNKHYISHWPQAGMIKRDSNRNGVQNVAYAGRLNNLLSGKVELNEIVKSLGLNFEVLDQTNWNDFSKIDICIGIRSFDRKAHTDKPATKLYNAWHAQVPFIGGYESAFEQVGTPDKNYIRVENENELIDSLIRLKENPELFNFLVRNGNEAKIMYDWGSITKEWIRFLEDIAVPHYQQWKSKSNRERSTELLVNFATAMFRKFLRLPRSLPNVIAQSIRKRSAIN